MRPLTAPDEGQLSYDSSYDTTFRYNKENQGISSSTNMHQTIHKKNKIKSIQIYDLSYSVDYFNPVMKCNWAKDFRKSINSFPPQNITLILLFSPHIVGTLFLKRLAMD